MISRFPARPPESGMSTVPTLIGLLLVLAVYPSTVSAEPERKFSEPFDTPLITNRAVENKGLDLKLDHEALIEGEHNPANGGREENSRDLRDSSTRVDWSRRVDDGWDLEPVLLNRRQAGKPIRPDDDQSDKLLGIELRKKF